MSTITPQATVELRETFKARISGSLAVGGFASPLAARAYFLARGMAWDAITVTPEYVLVVGARPVDEMAEILATMVDPDSTTRQMEAAYMRATTIWGDEPHPLRREITTAAARRLA